MEAVWLQLTRTRQVPVLPEASVAVTVHWPLPTMDTVPLASTVATLVLLDFQVTVPEAPVTFRVTGLGLAALMVKSSTTFPKALKVRVPPLGVWDWEGAGDWEAEGDGDAEGAGDCEGDGAVAVRVMVLRTRHFWDLPALSVAVM